MGAVRVKRDVSLLPLTNCFRTVKQPKLFPKCKTHVSRSMRLKRRFLLSTPTLTRTDTEVQTDVLAELRWDLSASAKDIGVAVKDGVVTLTGTVDTYLNKWKAEQAAHRVSGVTAVANDISVRTIGERTDSDIAAAAVNALKWNTSIPAEKIHVTVDKGWVTLKGEVEWQYQRQDAERAVRRLWGVKGVSNLVTVKPLATPADLKKKIEDALVRRGEGAANT